MSTKISRRDFLKISAGTLSTLAFSPFFPSLDKFADGMQIRITSNGLEDKGIPVYSRPTDESSIVRSVFHDNLLNVYEEVDSGTPGYNPIWYRVWGGFVHRARTQKVQTILNPVAQSIREKGQLAEITVPYTQALRLVGKEWRPLNRLYFTSVHWVKGIDPGPDGQPWYRVLDELLDINYNVQAKHMRLIPDEEITPITPEIPWENKRIEVSLAAQRVTCFENDKPVFTTMISSGRLNSDPGPNGIPTRTPAGKFHISVKMPSKHMGSGDLAQAADIGAYQLPGVPWTSFIQFEGRPFQGHAFHGTYWHDNYGVPMSSGCLNMRPEEAKWLFRWCLPLAPAEQINATTLDKRGYGTQGVIFA
ncbi:MAG TPA: L,D-transpeptidase [Anaerolineales bacterium]|jgi:hypothetical protein